MDRMELLKLALASAKSPAEALSLAREMAAFVDGGPPPPAPPPPSAPADLGVPDAETKLAAMRDNVAAKSREPRAKKHWTEPELVRAAALLDNGVSYAEVGRLLGRSGQAVLTARSDGKLPVKTHTLDPQRQMQGALGVVSRGFSLSPRVSAQLFPAKAARS